MGLGVSDALDELKSALKERFSSPVVGAFTLSWILVNHRLFFALFYAQSPAMRFGYIDEVIYPDTWSFTWKLILLPVAMGMGYIYLVPLATKRIYRQVLKNEMDILAVRKAAEGAKVLTKKEAEEASELANSKMAEAALALQLGETKLSEAQLVVRQKDAEMEAKRIEATQMVDVANAKVAAQVVEIADLRHAYAKERVYALLASKTQQAESQIEQLASLVDFSIEYIGDRGSVHAVIRLEQGGAITGEPTDFKKWGLKETTLVLYLDNLVIRADFQFNARSRVFEGHWGRGPLRLIPKDR